MELVKCCSYFFFFSSRRRHTRYWRDWSSDVCSSDLDLPALRGLRDRRGQLRGRGRPGQPAADLSPAARQEPAAGRGPGREIGRASCRERVEISVDAVSLKKKKDELYS